MKLANDMLHPDTSSLEGLETFLRTWFVLKFNTHFHDEALNNHTFVELLTLYYIHKMHNDPEWYESLDKPSDEESHEEWLRSMMGDDYVTEEEMAEDMIKYEEEERKILEELPETITTDFTDPDLFKE